MSDKQIYEFSKNSQERVKANLVTYRGRDLVDIRVFYADGGDWKPTRKGICLSLDLLPELEAAVKALREAVGKGSASSDVEA